MEWQEGRIGRVFVVRFDHGEVICNVLTQFIKEKNIRSGMVHFVGALEKTRCVSGPVVTELPPKPYWQDRAEAHELVGLGTIAWDGDEPVVHFHAALGREESCVLGCIRGEATVYLLIEAVIYEITGFAVSRVFDERLQIRRLTFE